MKISSILEMTIDPRPELHDYAAVLLWEDRDLYNRCQVFMNQCENDFDGWTPDELRWKWEQRIVSRVLRLIEQDYAQAITYSNVDGGAVIRYHDLIVAGPYFKATELMDARKRLLMGLVCGLNPNTLFEVNLCT